MLPVLKEEPPEEDPGIIHRLLRLTLYVDKIIYEKYPQMSTTIFTCEKPLRLIFFCSLLLEQTNPGVASLPFPRMTGDHHPPDIALNARGQGGRRLRTW